MCSQFTQPLCYTLYFVAMHPSEAHHLNSAHEICCFQNFLPQCFLEPNRCLCLVNGTFLFDCAGQHVGSSFPDQGPNPCSLQWKRGVLTTGPPANSPETGFLTLLFLSCPEHMGIFHYVTENGDLRERQITQVQCFGIL